MTVRLGTKLIANTGSGGTGGTNVLVDNITITKDENDIITTVAIDNKNDSSDILAVKTWMGTLAEYEAIENKSNDVIYYITDDETLAQSANIDLSNLSTTGQSKFDIKANKSLNNLDEQGEKHFLNKSQITNCLLEVPQNIKLELNNGVLTLKAGSKVIVPNGAGVFDEVAITTDRTPISNTLTGKYFIFASSTNLLVDALNIQSGSTFPSSATSGNKFYNTTENKFYRHNGTEWQPNGYSLPLAIVTLSSGRVTSIDQIFNGFGYIGSTVFVLPGVKGLASNGRNEDGTLNNIEVVTTAVRTRTFTTNETSNPCFLGISPVTNGIGRINVEDYYFDVVNNVGRITDAGLWQDIVFATKTSINGVISNFNPTLPFRAMDYQEAVNKSGDTMTGALNILADTVLPLMLRVTNGNSGTYNEIQFQDHLGVRRNTIRSQYTYDENGNIQKTTFIFGSNKLNSSAPQGLTLACDSSNDVYFSFPMCTSKATTTSTATTGRVAVIVQNYLNGTSWYRVWSDGWCEQGGFISMYTSGASVSLLQNYIDNNYNVLVSFGGTLDRDKMPAIYAKTTTSFKVIHGAALNSEFGLYWEAKGYRA